MKAPLRTQPQRPQPHAFTPAGVAVLQRKCACGGAPGPTGECESCRRKTLQRKLTVGASNDPLEQEADRIADQVLAAPAHPAVSGAPPRIQRFTRQAIEQAGTAPASVDRVLASPGKPLEPTLRQDMERRFGHDFSQVRVHSGGAAGQSALDVSANAYTVGQHMVFGEEQYAPTELSGRRLIAHELVHVVQQRNAPRNLVQRAETDTSKGCSHLIDTKSDVNALVNGELEYARQSGDGRADHLIASLYGALGEDTSLGRTAIEDWAANLDSKKAELPEQSSTKYAGVSYRFWRQSDLSFGFEILNPTMRVNGICIGSDKLGHFFQQGKAYHDVYKSALKEKKSVKEAEGEAKKSGIQEEVGIYGLQTTGIFSNADLEANRQGLFFHKQLAANPKLNFNIANYVNVNWNEEVNPNSYEKSVGSMVWKNLLTGLWKGSLETAGSAAPSSVTTKLLMMSETQLVGGFSYNPPSGKSVGGTISGSVTYLKDKLQGITGVMITFTWRTTSESGIGSWKSISESKLTGEWVGAAENAKGIWHLEKNPGTY